jgi:hypothetical protein
MGGLRGSEQGRLAAADLPADHDHSDSDRARATAAVTPSDSQCQSPQPKAAAALTGRARAPEATGSLPVGRGPVVRRVTADSESGSPTGRPAASLAT